MIVPQYTLVLRRQSTEGAELVVLLQRLYIILLYQLHDLSVRQLAKVAKVQVTKYQLYVVLLPVELSHVGAALSDERVLDDVAQLVAALSFEARLLATLQVCYSERQRRVTILHANAAGALVAEAVLTERQPRGLHGFEMWLMALFDPYRYV